MKEIKLKTRREERVHLSMLDSHPISGIPEKMDSKKRAALRAQANTLTAIFQIGRDGVTESVCSQVLEGFKTRELMKIKCLLKTLPCTVKEAADAVAAGCGAELVQTIGGSIILYKYNPELHKKKDTVKSKTHKIKKQSVLKKSAPKNNVSCAKKTRIGRNENKKY